MLPILTGLETEYGFSVEGHGAQEQVDDAMMLVRNTPDEHFAGWDYRFESPRADLKGGSVERLSFDPEDAKYDVGKSRPGDIEVRSDRILRNGARFYNDHGHPEYSTPECRSLEELAFHDLAGDSFLRSVARAFETSTGHRVKLYKNNTDGHGASYGTHESYLCPRSWGFERIYKATLPILIARQVVCGAGKVGAESGPHCDYQISQRADFFTEPASVDTLYRRPVFNTRDEPHADPAQWIRLHVICGDANRSAKAMQRKFAFVKLALWLEEVDRSPVWRIANPMEAFKSVSRDLTTRGRIDLEGANWTSPREIIESYVEAGERFLDCSSALVCESLALARESIELIDDWTSGGDQLARTADWAAKLRMLQQFIDDSPTDWRDPALRAYDLAYHDIDPDESLFQALADLDLIEPQPNASEVDRRKADVLEGTRARARAVAVQKFHKHLVTLSWGNLVFETPEGRRNISLKPNVEYPRDLENAPTIEAFIQALESLQ